MGTIAQEITRLQTAKADIKTAIEAKGVTVPSSALISDYDTYVSQITGGGSQPVLTTLTATENGTYTPGVGTDGYSQVVVNVQQIHDFDNAYNLFYAGRFLENSSDFLSKFNGVNINYIMSNCPVTKEAKMSVLSDWCFKALQNSGNKTSMSKANVLFSSALFNAYINQNDKDFILDGTNLTNNTSATSHYENKINVDDMFNSSSAYDYPGNITINLLASAYANKFYFTNGFGRIRCTGNLKIYSFFYSGTTYNLTGSYNIAEGGNLYEFCLIPTGTSGTINLSYLVDTMSEDTILRSLDLYEGSSWWTGKKLTIKLPSLLFSNLQQSTITAASNLGITLTS